MIRIIDLADEIGRMLRTFSLIMLAPILFALLMEPYDVDLGAFSIPRNALVFLASALTAYIVAQSLLWIGRNRMGQFHEKEAYLAVGIGWIVLVLFAMGPFMGSGVIPGWSDAFFESMSALTATGATIIATPLEDIAPSIMIWRAGLQFLGGMGIIVLSIALLARLTHGGALLLAAEMSGPSTNRIRPRMTETARTLWRIYSIFSAACFGMYFLVMRFDVGMAWGDAAFDALLHTFTTLSTAGFSNHSASIAFYDSWLIETVVVLFALIAGTNFALHDAWMRGDWRRLLMNPEWRFFIGMWAVATLVITAELVWTGEAMAVAFRGAAFTVASIGTSLGYATVDYDQWPEASKALLIVLMMTGASAGSTSGGIKALRILLLFKVVKRQLTKILHPRAVVPVRLAGRIVPDDALMTVTAFLFSFVAVWFAGAAFLITTDPSLDLFDGAVAAASAIGNTGPAMGVVGPTDHFGILLPSSKIAMSIMMWIGRLEVFTALLVFIPSIWRRG